MYQGKHTRTPAPKKHRRLRWRKEFLMLCSALVLLIGVVGGTIAYLVTNTDPVKNTFTPASPGIDIEEKFDKETKQNVKAENTSNYPVYVRATYVAYWVSDEEGPNNGSILPGDPNPTGSFGSDWTKIGDYWYYNKVLKAGEKSTDFIVSMTAGKIEGQHLVVDVIMESVQAEGVSADGKTPIEEVWGIQASSFIK